MCSSTENIGISGKVRNIFTFSGNAGRMIFCFDRTEESGGVPEIEICPEYFEIFRINPVMSIQYDHFSILRSKGHTYYICVFFIQLFFL